jgi:polysaccharide biosynthesis protein PslJ
MTAVAERPAPPATGRGATAARPPARRIDAVTVLGIYTLLLMGIPAALVVAPLGAVGGPATIFAALVFIFYLVTWLHPALAPARGRQPVRFAAILLTCAVIATYVSANRHMVPGLERNGMDRGIILICGWLGVLVMASDGIPSMDRLKKLLGWVVIGATAMATIGITQFFTGLDATQYIIIPGLKVGSLSTDLLSRNGLNRPSATAAHPLEFAAVLGMVLPIAINRARFAPPGKRLTRWLQVGLIGAALPMTVSRSAILGILAVCFVLLPTWPKIERRIAYGVLALGVMGLWFLTPGLLGTFRTLFATLSGDTSTTSRTGALSMASPFVSQHPWFGRGFGTFFPATYFFTDDQYLLSLMEIGVVGLLALLALFITGLVTAQRVRRATTDPEMRDLGQSLTATIAVSMVAFGTFDALSFNMAAGLTFLLLGCTGAAWRLIRAQGAQANGHLARLPMVQPDPEPPAITHRSPPGASGALGGLAGIRAGRQSNGHLTEPAEKTSQQQPNGHPPKAAERQPERPADPRQPEPAEAQVEKLADKYPGERAGGQLEQRAGGHPAEPAGPRPGEPAEAWMKQTASPPWEDQPWPWGTGEERAGAHQQLAAEGHAAAAWDPWRKPEPPVHQTAEAADRAAAEPAGQTAPEPEAQTAEPAGQPAPEAAAQAAEPAGQLAPEAEAQADEPARQLISEPEAQTAEPAGQPAPEPEAQADEPAAAAWDAWRKPESPADQAATEAPGQTAATEPAGPTGQAAAAAPEQQEEPAEQAAEPAGERPEESTVPIPVIRD